MSFGNTDRTLLEKILITKLVSYKLLEEIFVPYMNKKSNDINIFVDLHSLYNNLYNPSIYGLFEDLRENKQFHLTIYLLKLVAHYRYYFWNREQKFTNFFFYYASEKSSYHLELEPNWKKDWYERRFGGKEVEKRKKEDKIRDYIAKLFMDNFVKFKTISNYLPYTNVIDTKDIDSIVVPLIIIKGLELEKKTNIIMTNDQTQSVLVSQFPKTYLFQNRSANTAIIDKDNLIFPYYKNITKIPKVFFEEEELNTLIFEKFIRIWNLISTNTSYDIKPIKEMNIRKFLSMLKTNIKKDHLSLDSKVPPSEVLNKLVELGEIKDNVKDEMIKMAKLVDPVTIRYNLIKAKHDIILNQILHNNEGSKQALISLNNNLIDKVSIHKLFI
jgi:hypothetical protein